MYVAMYVHKYIMYAAIFKKILFVFYREFTSLFVRGYLAIRLVITHTPLLLTCVFCPLYESSGHTVRKYVH